MGTLKQHPPFPLIIKIVSHLILKGITARLPIWEIQNRALFMAAQRPTPAPDCPFLLLSEFNTSNIPGELRCIICFIFCLLVLYQHYSHIENTKIPGYFSQGDHRPQTQSLGRTRLNAIQKLNSINSTRTQIDALGTPDWFVSYRIPTLILLTATTSC